MRNIKDYILEASGDFNVNGHTHNSTKVLLYDILYNYYTDDDYAYDDDWIDQIENVEKTFTGKNKNVEISLRNDENGSCFMEFNKDHALLFSMSFSLGSDSEIQAELVEEKHIADDKTIDDIMTSLWFVKDENLYILTRK